MIWRLIPLWLLVALGPIAAAQTRLPAMQAPTLSGKHATLPNDAAGRVALLIIGFSHGSKPADTAWARSVEKEFGGDRNFVLYQIAAVEEIPRLFRGMAEHGMRSDVPAAQQDRFLLLQKDEQAWKRFVGYSQKDDAYLLLLDRSGEVRSQWHGPFDKSEYQKLAGEIRALEK